MSLFKLTKTKLSYRFAGFYFRTIGTDATFFRINDYHRNGLLDKLDYHYWDETPKGDKAVDGTMDLKQFEKQLLDGRYEFIHDDEQVPYGLRNVNQV